MLFSDDALGDITQWIDSHGEVHQHYVEDTVSVVAKHPGDYERPWYAAALFQEERA